jgi:tetratricopeptide (TPR) repeat protein
VETSPTKSADGFVNLGACLMAKGQADDAMNCFKNALELDPTHFEAIYNLGGHFSFGTLNKITRIFYRIGFKEARTLPRSPAMLPAIFGFFGSAPHSSLPNFQFTGIKGRQRGRC